MKTEPPTPTHKYVDEKQKQEADKKTQNNEKQVDCKEKPQLQRSEGNTYCCTCGTECGPWYLCYNCTANIVFANATSSAAGIVTVFLRPGSAFNPAGDAAAMQPQMFDQFAQMYERYKVNSATIHWRVQGATSDQPAGSTVWHAAVYPAVDSTPLATYQAAASQQYAKT